MKGIYFEDMYNSLQDTFERMYSNLSASRGEVKEQIYKAQQEER